MNDTARSIARGPLIAGLVLVGLGLASLFDRFDWFGWPNLWKLWPLVVIGVGVTIATSRTEAKDRRGGVLLVLFGLWFLVNTFEVFGLDWGDSWPLIFVIFGILKVIERRLARGLLLIGIGLWIQAAKMRLGGLDLESSWPFALVAFGLYLVVGAFGRRSGNSDERSRS